MQARRFLVDPLRYIRSACRCSRPGARSPVLAAAKCVQFTSLTIGIVNILERICRISPGLNDLASTAVVEVDLLPVHLSETSIGPRGYELAG